jgi:hypothetical protein
MSSATLRRIKPSITLAAPPCLLAGGQAREHNARLQRPRD